MSYRGSRVATDPGNLEKPGNPGKSWKNLENGHFPLKNLEKPEDPGKTLKMGSPKPKMAIFPKFPYFTPVSHCLWVEI